MNKIEYGCLIGIFMIGLFFWSLPYQDNKYPYGETDSTAHFGLADNWASQDHAEMKLPYYLKIRYVAENPLSPGDTWYPPQYHTSLAISQIFGGDRFVSLFLFNTILCLLLPIAIFFFMTKMYNLYSGLGSAGLYFFALRDFNTYVWGQWPTLISYAFVLIVLYIFYKYLETYRGIYLYLIPVLLTGQFLIHPLGAFISIITLGFYYIFRAIKDKKIMLISFKQFGIIIGAFLFLTIALAPTQTTSVFMFATGTSDINYYSPTSSFGFSFNNFITWYHIPPHDAGYPESYYSFSDNHNGYWIIPLVLLGALFCIWKRSYKNLILLSLLATLYLVFHLYAFGVSTAYDYRLFSLETFILCMFAGMTIYAAGKIHKVGRYIMIIAVLALICFNAYSIYPIMKNAYSGPIRITQPQYEVANWMSNNLPVESMTWDIGTLSLAKITWMRSVSHRLMGDKPVMQDGFRNNISADFVMIDFSDAIAIQNEPAFNQLLNIENRMNNDTQVKKIYDKDYIKIYGRVQ